MAMKKSSSKYQSNQFAGYKGGKTEPKKAGPRTARNRGKRRPD